MVTVMNFFFLIFLFKYSIQLNSTEYGRTFANYITIIFVRHRKTYIFFKKACTVTSNNKNKEVYRATHQIVWNLSLTFLFLNHNLTHIFQRKNERSNTCYIKDLTNVLICWTCLNLLLYMTSNIRCSV